MVKKEHHEICSIPLPQKYDNQGLFTQGTTFRSSDSRVKMSNTVKLTLAPLRKEEK